MYITGRCLDQWGWLSQPFALLQAPCPGTPGEETQDGGREPSHPCFLQTRNVYCCQMKRFRRQENTKKIHIFPFPEWLQQKPEHAWKQEIVSEDQYFASQEQARGDATIFPDVFSFCSHPVLPMWLAVPLEGRECSETCAGQPTPPPPRQSSRHRGEAPPSQGRNPYPQAADTFNPSFQRVETTFPYISNPYMSNQ